MSRAGYKSPNAGDGSRLTNVSADKLKGLTMSGTAPADGQALVFNATTNQMEWTDLNTANQNKLIENGTNGLAKYVGYASAGTTTSTAAWAIQLLLYDSKKRLLSRQWAGGTSTYTKVWDSRAGYTYS